MKKVITSLFVLRLRAVLATTLLLLPLASKAQFSGTGTENDPYIIFNPIQLDQMRNFLDKRAYFKLMADIDLTEWIANNSPEKGWEPIGNKDSPFWGYFDGNGHKITGLFINRPTESYIGLFGSVRFSNIENVSVEGNVIGADYVSILVGYCYGNISGCNVTGKIKGKYCIGGIVGYWNPWEFHSDNHPYTISGNVSKVNIQAEGGCVGGIAGMSYLDGSVSDNISLFNIQVGHSNYKSQYIGGIVGYWAEGSGNKIITCNVAIGSIKSVDNIIGGICGYGVSVSCSNNYFFGNLQGRSNIGGVVGENFGRIENNYVKASIVGEEYIGGIVGRDFGDRVYNNVAINKQIASLLGSVGRITGHVDGDSQYRNYTLSTTKINGIDVNLESSSQNGDVREIPSLRTKAFYESIGWDFDNTWDIREAESFPYLKGQTAPPAIESMPVSGDNTISGKSAEGGIIEVYVGKESYTATCNGNDWTVTTKPLQAGELISVFAKADDKSISYPDVVYVGYKGDGTEENPYKITTVEDLRNINGDGYYKLENNLDLTEWIEANSPTDGWPQIDVAGGLNAHIDGGGHTISGLWSCNSILNSGLFSFITNGTIKNLAVTVADGKQIKGVNVGIIANTNIRGNITKCRVSGNMIGTCNSTSSITGIVGGLVGINGMAGIIENCYSEASATTTTSKGYNNNYAAGLVGLNYGSVSNCYASGDINSSFVGAGVIARNDGENATASRIVALNKNITIENKNSDEGYGMRVIGNITNSAPVPGNDIYALESMVVSKNGILQTIYDDPLQGYKKSEKELKTKSLYETLGWDMETTWGIDEGTSYPYLLIFDIPVTSVTLGKTEAKIEQRQTLSLTATVSPEDARNKELSWSSSDETVATVSTDGIVTAVKAGEATITATTTDGTELSAACKVTVINSTGIDMTYKNSLNVSTADKKIIVSGADDGTLIKVYGINGQLLSSGTNAVIPVSVSGVYIVEIEGLRYKIGVK